MKSALTRRPRVPAIAHLVLSQLVRLRSGGTISDADFENKISRVEREELTPRGLHLYRREMSGCRMRFLIKTESTGDFCDLVD